ncbi:hypothetical protein N9D95_01965 [Flavobacteriales bacterium]|nr:hypothetical protein [Flavobacteriales bacterium]
MKFTPSFFLMALMANLGSVFSQNICDECLPAFEATTLPSVQAFCDDNDPLSQLPGFPSFATQCAENLQTAVFKYTLGETAECYGFSAMGLPSDLGGFQLQDFTATGLTSTSAFFPTSDGMTWTVYPQNVARLQGTIANANNIGAKFDVDLYFEFGSVGSQWPADAVPLNDAAAVGNASLDWRIWQIEPKLSKLVGREDLEGELIYLDASGLDISYPFQEGEGGNTVNSARGLGGEF